VNRFQESFS